MAILTNIKFHHGRDSGCSLMILTTLFYIAIIILHGEMCNAQPKLCNPYQYRNGSKFERNLKTVLNNLVQHTSQTGFNTSVYGQSPDQIFGLLQCRGDTTVDQCYNCSLLVTSQIKQFCGNGVGVRVWFDFCYLRYENNSFLGQMEDSGIYVNLTANSTNPPVSNAVVDKLWSKLSAEAASAMKRCAFSITVDSSFRKIYGQAECTRDISTEDCKKCLSQTMNDSLVKYPGSQGLQGLMSSCIVRYEIHSFFNLTAISLAPAEAPANTPPKKITPSNKYSSSDMKSSHKIPIILGSVGGFLLILFVCLFTNCRRWKSAIFRRGYEGHGQVEEDRLSQEQQIVRFKMKTLVDATENFHDDNKLGEGGFGPVYKGTTQDGKEIAVKKLSLKSMQGRKEFLNEVKLVAKIRHRNIVNILGCCAERSERLLVYEYLPNRSLDKVLRDPNKHLDWQKRHDIIMGVARGLLYLHQDSHLRIIHRDIKASNILLDDKMNPKIADFGLARLFPEGATHVSTRVAGTYGYMAPEYALQGKLSVKADVYSFGVVVMELVTGRKGSDYDFSSETQTLLGLAWRSYQQGNMVQMIDPAIVETCNEEQALRCLHVGLLCTQADASLRPPMSTIILMLSPQYVGLPDPTKPAFVMSVSVNTEPTNSRPLPLPQPQVLSNADASITNLVPR